MLDRAHFLPHIGSGEETRIQYSQLCQALDEYMHRIFYDFTVIIPKVPTIHGMRDVGSVLFPFTLSATAKTTEFIVDLHSCCHMNSG